METVKILSTKDINEKDFMFNEHIDKFEWCKIVNEGDDIEEIIDELDEIDEEDDILYDEILSYADKHGHVNFVKTGQILCEDGTGVTAPREDVVCCKDYTGEYVIMQIVSTVPDAYTGELVENYKTLQFFNGEEKGRISPCNIDDGVVFSKWHNAYILEEEAVDDGRGGFEHENA